MVKRPQVGKPVKYKGHKITVTVCGPDLLTYVNGEELPNFAIDLRSAVAKGQRYVDDKIAEKEKCK